MDAVAPFSELFWPTHTHVLRVVVAVVLSGLIGLERELRDKPAGFRTIVLIGVGACLFSMLSDMAGGPEYQSTRIAAQVVTGIGFLGAGAILTDRGSVLGLTTAATIWSVAAVGMLVGFGYLPLGVLGTVVILTALLLFDIIENWVADRRDIQEYHIATDNSHDAFDRIKSIFGEAVLKVRKCRCHEEGDVLVFFVVAMGTKVHHDQLRIKLVRSDNYTLRGT